MKKSELIAAISTCDKKPPEKDVELMSSRLASFLLDEIHVDSVKNNHLYDLDIENPSPSRQTGNANKEQLSPFQYLFAWEKYLSAGTTTRFMRPLKEGTEKFDVPLEEQIETMDAYIPEPLRNADGTPIYSSISDDTACASTVGMFAQQQNPAKSDSLRADNSSFSSSAASVKK